MLPSVSLNQAGLAPPPRWLRPFYRWRSRSHPYPLETMLRVHLMQNWFGLSDPGMEEALYEVAPMRAIRAA